MYGMASSLFYEVNQKTIIASEPRGNKLEIVEWSWRSDRR
jgi:hypothetical protein